MWFSLKNKKIFLLKEEINWQEKILLKRMISLMEIKLVRMEQQNMGSKVKN